AFSPAPDEASCLEISKMVGGILRKSGYEIHHLGCHRSSQTFSPFEHGAPENAPRHTYLIEVSGQLVTVTLEKSLEACQQHLRDRPAAKTSQTWCANSTQKPGG
ncbi:MAG: hypothetical protein AB7O70_01865, partial [Hyphomicrobiales bacterium]